MNNFESQKFESTQAYLIWAKSVYKTHYKSIVDYLIDGSLVTELHVLGKSVGLVNCSDKTFHRVLYGSMFFDGHDYRNTPRHLSRSFYDRHKVDFRESLSFVKNHSNCKAKLTASLNRESKTKDYRRSRKSVYGKARTHSLKQESRNERRRVKALIHHERYDEIETIRHPVDSWNWD